MVMFLFHSAVDLSAHRSELGGQLSHFRFHISRRNTHLARKRALRPIPLALTKHGNLIVTHRVTLRRSASVEMRMGAPQ
jgi:hypothetical protein